ncbi:MAG: hypothetical protein H6705_02540 [Myxococcales bacterium]|nr:hypothetical protein [Myxococcales bacterium]
MATTAATPTAPAWRDDTATADGAPAWRDSDGATPASTAAVAPGATATVTVDDDDLRLPDGAAGSVRVESLGPSTLGGSGGPSAVQGAAVVGGLAAGVALHRRRGDGLVAAAVETQALIAGAPLDPEAPATPANRLARALADQLEAWLGTRGEARRRSVEPRDLGDAPPATLALVRAGDRAPTLLVQIAPPEPTPATLDAWFEAGPAELWLLRPTARTLTRHVRGAHGWRVEEWAAGATHLPGFTLDLDALWRALEG